MIELAIRIDNRNYERRLEKQGQYSIPGLQKKAKPQQLYQYPRKMELDTTRHQGKKKPQLSQEERNRRREKQLCFECRLPGHQAASYRKKGKQQVSAATAKRTPKQQISATHHRRKVRWEKEISEDIEDWSGIQEQDSDSDGGVSLVE